jgi:hypothetical protein
MRNHEGIIKILVATPLNTLYFSLPSDHEMVGILLNPSLIPNTAPVHPKRMDVCRKLNQGPIISLYL